MYLNGLILCLNSTNSLKNSWCLSKASYKLGWENQVTTFDQTKCGAPSHPLIEIRDLVTRRRARENDVYVCVAVGVCVCVCVCVCVSVCLCMCVWLRDSDWASFLQPVEIFWDLISCPSIFNHEAVSALRQFHNLSTGSLFPLSGTTAFDSAKQSVSELGLHTIHVWSTGQSPKPPDMRPTWWSPARPCYCSFCLPRGSPPWHRREPAITSMFISERLSAGLQPACQIHVTHSYSDAPHMNTII